MNEHTLLQRFSTPLLSYSWQEIERQLEFQKSLGVVPMLPVRICPEPYILGRLAQRGCGLICSGDTELRMVQKLTGQVPEIWLDSMAPNRETVELSATLHARVAVTDYEMARQVISWGAKRLLVRYQTDKANSILGRAHPLMERVQMFNRHVIPLTKLLGGDMDVVLEAIVEGKTVYTGAWAEAVTRLLAGQRTLCRVGESFFGGISLNLQGLLRSDMLEPELAQVRQVLAQRRTPVYLQAGRLLVESAGTMYARVEHVRLGAPDTVILSTTMAQLARTALLGGSHSYSLLESREEGMAYYEIMGTLPERTDLLERKVLLPQVHQGDVLRIHGVGAYERAMASAYGGSLGCPVVLVDGESVTQLRRKSTMEDCWRDISTW